MDGVELSLGIKVCHASRTAQHLQEMLSGQGLCLYFAKECLAEGPVGVKDKCY